MLRVKACLNTLCELNLIGSIEQGRFANAVQINAYEVGGWTLGVQIALDATKGGIRHDGLLIGSNCQEL
jgi:hypothetical protein